MARYSFDGTNLNDPNNYDRLNDDGTPVLDGQGLPVHPSSVPGAGDIVENLSGGMSGAVSVGSFLSWEFAPIPFLALGSIDAGTVGHTGAGGGASTAIIRADTIVNGTSARANGSVEASTVAGGAGASDGGTVTVTSQLSGGASASNGGHILGANATFDSASASGEVGGPFNLVAQIGALKSATGKLLSSVANERALSAAYAIASAADRVYVTRTGEIGSVDVVAVRVDESGADAKAGLAWSASCAGANILR